MKITQKLVRRIADILKALCGEPEALEELQNRIIDRSEKIVKHVCVENGNDKPDCFEIMFSDGEITGGHFFSYNGDSEDDIELSNDEAEIVANAYNITELE